MKNCCKAHLSWQEHDKNFYQSFTNMPVGGELVPVYTMALVFDPDIRNDGNTDNNDRSKRNNKVTLSHGTLSNALNKASLSSSAQRNIKPVKKYNYQPKVKY